MKLILFIDSLGSGGAQKQFVELSLGLNRRQIPFQVLTYYPDHNFFHKQLSEVGIPIQSIDKSTCSSLSFHQQLLKYLLKFKPTHIISFLDTPNLYSLIFKILRPSTTVIVSERASRFYGNYILNIFRILSFNLFDYVVCNSRDHRNWCSRFILNSEKKLLTIYNGYNSFSRSKPASSFRKSYYDKNPLNFVCVGTITPEKNIHTLLYALEHFHKLSGHQFNLSIYGRVDDALASKRYYKYLRSYVSNSRVLKSSVSFKGLSKDIYSLISSSSALIHPSFHEGLPNVVCESFFLRTLVLASRVCELPHLIGNDERGILFDPCSIESISFALLKFSKLSTLEIATRTEQAHHFATQNFAIEHLVNSYYGLLCNQ